MRLHSDKVPEDTQVMLTNAIYFKDAWKVPFHQSGIPRVRVEVKVETILYTIDSIA